MAARRYSREELARRGDEIFEHDIRPQLVPGDEQKLILIDVDTGAYEIDDDEHAAFGRLRARRPDAQVWMRRVGSPYARRFGPRRAPTTP